MKTDKILCFLVLISVVGCATPFGTYMKDRGNDFADCFKADVGVGLGIDAQVMVTDIVAIGVGGSVTRKVGFKGRHVNDWWDKHFGFPLMPFLLIYEVEGRPCWPWVTTSIGTFGGEWEHALMKCYLPHHEDPNFPTAHTWSVLFLNCANLIGCRVKPFIDVYDIECGVTAGVVGARVGFSPGQFLDFVLGWSGVDIGKDDTKEKEKEPTVPAKEP